MSGAHASEAILPSGWEYPRLVEIARVNPARNTTLSDEDHVNFVPMRAVAPEGGGLVDPEVRLYREVKKGYTSFQAGDVISAKITPCMENGKTAVVPALAVSGFFGSTEFHVVRPEKGIDPRWLSRFLLQQMVRREAQRAMSGAVGQMRVPGSFIENLRVPLAPSAEQIRVADAIDELSSDLEAAVNALERVRAKLKKYRATVLKAAVEGDLTAQWRMEHPDLATGSELLKRILAERRRHWEEDQLGKFKEKGQEPPKNWSAKYKEPVAPDTANLPSLPEGWCWATLDQIGDTQGGLQKTPGRSPVRNHFPYLRVANVHRGQLDLREMHRFEVSDEELRRLRLQRGDILIVEGNGSHTEIGRCAIWRGELENCIHQNHIIRVRPFAGIVAEFVDFFLNSPDGQSAIQRVASSTSGLYTLSVTKIEKLPVPLATSIEQEAIVEAVDDHLSLIDHLERDVDAKVISSLALRQAISRNAFAGKLVPQDPNDKPASELLKRIAAERTARMPIERNGKIRRSRRVAGAKIRKGDVASPTESRED